jgi:hypothetical protein
MNNPAHYSDLSVSPGSGTSSVTFLAGVWVSARFTYWAGDDLLVNLYTYDWSNSNWVSFGEMSTHPTNPSLNYSTLDDTVLQGSGISGTSRENLLVAILEVLQSDSFINQALFLMTALLDCNQVGLAVNRTSTAIASNLGNVIAARFIGSRVEGGAWSHMRDRCIVEKGCKLTLECLVGGVLGGGGGMCSAENGFYNQCFRDLAARKVICIEYDKDKRVISESFASCEPQPGKGK